MSGYGEQDNGQWSTHYSPIVPSSQQHHMDSAHALYSQQSTQNPYPSSATHSQDVYPPYSSYPSHPAAQPHFGGVQPAGAYSHSLSSAPHPHTQIPPSQSLSLSNPLDRRSITFRFSTNNTAIYNSRIYDSYGKSPFDITSRGQKTTFQSADGNPIAVIHWDYTHPIMIYRGTKFKCMDWFPYNSEKQSRTITHAGKRYYTTDRDNTVYFMPVDKPGHVLAIWRDPNDISELEVFEDALEVPGLHEVFLLATLLLAQSNPIGDFRPAGQ